MRAEQNNNSARALHFLVHFFTAISRLWREICVRDLLWRMQTDEELIFHFLYLRAVKLRESSHTFHISGAPNENLVQNHLNIALLNVF